MKCPTDNQLLEALAQTGGDETVRPHIQECAVCTERVRAIEASRKCVLDVHAWLDRQHERERDRLLARLADMSATDRSMADTPAAEFVTTRRRRVGNRTVSTVAAATLVVCAVLVLRPASAFEKAVACVRDTLSYSVQIEVTKPRRTEHLKLLRSGDRFRMEVYEDGTIVEHTITSREKPGIAVYTKDRSFIRRSPDRGKAPPLVVLEELANFKGNGRELGSKVIGGRQRAGFVVNLNEIDPDAPGGTLQMWVDSETSRPVEMTMDFGSMGSMRFFAFDWNAAPAAESFNTEPPQGYVDRTPEPTGNQELVAHAKRALQTYRELIGTYPKVKIPFADRMRDEMFEKIGDKRNDPRSDEYVQVHRAMTGFSHMMAVFRHNEDAVYYGRTVKAADGNKVLFRWKTEDGRYQVIYGDLTAELVSEARLRTIEGQ